MVFVEVAAEVAADGVVGGFAGFAAEGFGEPGHVLAFRVYAPDDADEFADAVGTVVVEPGFVSDGDDAVGVGREGFVAAGVEAFVAGVGVDQAGSVETVAAHHAADCK